MPKQARMVGWAHTVFGKSPHSGLEGLIAEVGPAALAHAGIDVGDVDCVVLGTFNNGFVQQGFEAALVGAAIPALAPVPALRCENACATGTTALYAGCDMIEAGRARIVLVIGAEKMTALPGAEVGEVLLKGSYLPEEGAAEAEFAGIFGQIAEAYFARHGDQGAALAQIAAKNHANAMRNPYAHMQKDLGFDFCNTVSDRNPRVAGPLRRTDCAPVSDGAVAVVLAEAGVAASLPRAIGFRARAQANDAFPLSRRDPIRFDGAHRAWHLGLVAAAVGLDDLDLVETHDCFTIAEMIEYEAMGLCPPGEGWRAAQEGWTARGGWLPVNLSGGLKARGHPLGATGVSMHVMVAMQLMNEAGAMQHPGATLGAVFNMGGAAVANYVSVLERTG
ncbi:MAG: acetyl-CoA acetyltransferase [Rhodobacter sp.]|nr:acetyl-CoA acetyltransferase [Rhodobacter sp.]